jgi:hypothetical protein
MNKIQMIIFVNTSMAKNTLGWTFLSEAKDEHRTTEKSGYIGYGAVTE